jgi:hypothetical protein
MHTTDHANHRPAQPTTRPTDPPPNQPGGLLALAVTTISTLGLTIRLDEFGVNQLPRLHKPQVGHRSAHELHQRSVMSNNEVETLIAELKQQVAERRRAGDYPVGLEQQLESEFRGMMRAIDRHEIDTERLHDLADGVRATAHNVRVTGGTDSRVPGGAVAHLASESPRP